MVGEKKEVISKTELSKGVKPAEITNQLTSVTDSLLSQDNCIVNKTSNSCHSDAIFKVKEELDEMESDLSANTLASDILEPKFFYVNVPSGSTADEVEKEEKKHKTLLIIYKCNICEVSFTTLRALEKHLLLHACNKSFKCLLCGKLFKYVSLLKLHMIRHSDQKPFKCSVCDKRFTSKNGLNIHGVVHQEERPHSCILCGKSFKRKNCMKYHLQRVHMVNPM